VSAREWDCLCAAAAAAGCTNANRDAPSQFTGTLSRIGRTTARVELEVCGHWSRALDVNNVINKDMRRQRGGNPVPQPPPPRWSSSRSAAAAEEASRSASGSKAPLFTVPSRGRKDSTCAVWCGLPFYFLSGDRGPKFNLATCTT